jgi:hypothetical protein
VGDIVVSGFKSGPITLRMSPENGYYYTDTVITGDEVTFGGKYTINSGGAGDYGAFSSEITFPTKLSIAQPAGCGPTGFLPQDRALDVRWNDPSDDEVWITLSVVDSGTPRRSWSLFCQAKNDGEFTIPADMMAKLPSGVTSQTLSMNHWASQGFDIPGMDSGSFSASVYAYLSCY